MSLATLLAALALVTAGVFVALAFTAWGRRRPLHRYGALSVAGHLMLLAGLATVRTGGPPQSGAEDAPPVRVSLVMRTVEPPDPEPVVEPTPEPDSPSPVETPERVEPVEVEPEPVPTPANVEPPSADPEVAEPIPPETREDSAQVATQANVAPTPTAAAELAPTAPESFVPPQAQPISQPPAPIERTPEPPPQRPAADTPPPPLAPSAYSQRGDVQRRRLAEDQGGTEQSLDAVAAAVDWLARAQSRNGSWDARAWGAGREQEVLGENRGAAGGRAETGLTGLALLAMGGAGHTHLGGPYQDQVTAGLQFLLDSQQADGSLAGDAKLFARTYCHSMATFALAEAMAVTGDQRLRTAVEAAVAYLESAQHRDTGSWRYRPGERGDTSQMGWAVMALRSAELAGVPIQPRSWRLCERYLDSVRSGSSGGLACYQPQRPRSVSPTMTAEAMYCRQILGVVDPRAAAADEAVRSLLVELPGSRRRGSGRAVANLYYWYYATLALHHHRSKSPEAEQAWDTWNDAMQRAILPRQVPGGALAGSWDPTTLWGGYGGRVYSTALATMCLEVYYRYDPDKIGRDPWIAARPAGTLRR